MFRRSFVDPYDYRHSVHVSEDRDKVNECLTRKDIIDRLISGNDFEGLFLEVFNRINFLSGEYLTKKWYIINDDDSFPRYKYRIGDRFVHYLESNFPDFFLKYSRHYMVPIRASDVYYRWSGDIDFRRDGRDERISFKVVGNDSIKGMYAGRINIDGCSILSFNIEKFAEMFMDRVPVLG